MYAVYDHNIVAKYSHYRDNELNIHVADDVAWGMYDAGDRKCMLFQHLGSIYRVECCDSGVDDTLILTIAKCINTNEYSFNERSVEKLIVDRQRPIYDLHYDMFTHHTECGEKITYCITRGKLYDSMRNATKIKTMVHIKSTYIIECIRTHTEDYDTPNGMAHLALTTSLNLKASDDILLILADWLQKYHISLTTEVLCLEK